MLEVLLFCFVVKVGGGIYSPPAAPPSVFSSPLSLPSKAQTSDLGTSYRDGKGEEVDDVLGVHGV